MSDEAILHQTGDNEVAQTPDQLYEDLAYWQTRVSKTKVYPLTSDNTIIGFRFAK